MILSFSFFIFHQQLHKSPVLFKNNFDWITGALRSIFITKTSSLLWLRPTLLVASSDWVEIELQYEL
jgi:hypothetical protein